MLPELKAPRVCPVRQPAPGFVSAGNSTSFQVKEICVGWPGDLFSSRDVPEKGHPWGETEV